VFRFLLHRSDAVEESLVIISPHGLNPKVKRLVLKPHCLTVLVRTPAPYVILFLLNINLSILVNLPKITSNIEITNYFEMCN
jgi:hypothetical protein